METKGSLIWLIPLSMKGLRCSETQVSALTFCGSAMGS